MTLPYRPYGIRKQNDNLSSRALQLPPSDSIISPAVVGFPYQIRKAWYI